VQVLGVGMPKLTVQPSGVAGADCHGADVSLPACHAPLKADPPGFRVTLYCHTLVGHADIAAGELGAAIQDPLLPGAPKKKKKKKLLFFGGPRRSGRLQQRLDQAMSVRWTALRY